MLKQQTHSHDDDYDLTSEAYRQGYIAGLSGDVDRQGVPSERNTGDAWKAGWSEGFEKYQLMMRSQTQ